MRVFAKNRLENVTKAINSSLHMNNEVFYSKTGNPNFFLAGI